jgi:GT2 family glycosyltransferase
MNLAGFDEQLSQQYQDVDLCLRARESGLAVYIDNSNFLYHLESQTVKIDLNSYRVVKKRGDEHKYFLRRWRNYLLTPDNFISEVPIELRN